MLEKSVTEIVWGFTSFVLSRKSNVTNDKTLKARTIQGSNMKSLKGPTGKFPSPGGPPRPCM